LSDQSICPLHFLAYVPEKGSLSYSTIMKATDEIYSKLPYYLQSHGIGSYIQSNNATMTNVLSIITYFAAVCHNNAYQSN
jgi:hypothetical protein